MIRKHLKKWMFCLGCFGLLMASAVCKNESDISISDKASTEKVMIEANKNQIISKPNDNDKGQSMTLMVYMIGSDLEAATAAATKDMQEMEASGIDLSKVNLLIYTGGSPKWHNDALEVPVDRHAVYQLTKNGFEAVTEFDAISMGESECLTRFLTYGYENHPSETYGLILWDHGNGPVMGYGSDLLYDKDALTLPEIETSLKNSPFGGDARFEFIGFDACLMASAELACMVDDYADYLIASQEVEPGFGWNYEFLAQCGKVNTSTLLQNIVDSYISYSEAFFEQNTFFKSEVTLAVVDLSYASELEKAIDNLFAEASENIGDEFNQLALHRVETRAFGRATTGSEYDLVDLQALMGTMKKSYSKETKAVEAILKDMIVYSDSNTVQSCGLSLYYPYYNKKYYESSWKESYGELGLLPSYLKYLEGYEEIWLGTDMKEYFSGRLVASDHGSGTYTLQLNEEQNERYADAGFYILRQMGEDGYSLVYYSQNVTNEDGVLTAKFDGRVLYYGDDLGFKGIPVTRYLDEVDGKTRYAIFPTLTGSVEDFLESEDLPCRVVVSVDPETSEVTILDFSESSNDEIQTGKKPQVNLEDWIRIQFFEIRSRYITRDSDGRLLNYWEWPEGDWILWNEISLADGLNFSYEPIYDDGSNYYLMFDIMDVQGNQYSSELFPITLEEAPPEEEIPPTDAGTLEEQSLLIREQDGVQIYLDIIDDSVLRDKAYVFCAENSNDFPVHIYITDMIVNENISASDVTGYLSIEPRSSDYTFMKEISSICELDGVDHASALTFALRMTNGANDKTLIKEETFTLKIGDEIQPKRVFLPLLDARAEKQVLTSEEDPVQIELMGAGYELNASNYFPDSEYASISGSLRFENTSETDQNIYVEGFEVNEKFIDTDYYSLSQRKVLLEPGTVYYYHWQISKEDLLGLDIQEITSMANVVTITSGDVAQKKTFTITLAED